MGDVTERELIHRTAMLIAMMISRANSKCGKQFWEDVLKEYERIVGTGEP